MILPVDPEAESFYSERDSRTNLLRAQPPEPVNLAVTLAPGWAGSRDGQLTMYWLASLISRMGRRFNRLQICLGSGAAEAPCLIDGLSAPNLAAALLMHLGMADPFGDYSIVERPAEGSYVVAVGGLDEGEDAAIVRPNGWAASLTRVGAYPSPSADDPGNPIGAALAAALGAAQVYQHFNSESLGYEAQSPLWISAFQRAASRREAESSDWAQGPPLQDVDVGRWLVVGAGALGGNVLEILGQVRGLRGHIEIVDPDTVEMSNLNRQLQAVVMDRGVPKAVVSVRSISGSGIGSVAHVKSYEQLTQRYDAQRVIIETFDLVLTGVDQAATRAFVQSDWPRMTVNAGTRGYSWRVSAHPVETEGACVGCLAGKGQRNYGDLHAPLACAGGLAGPAPQQETPMDSYGFVSFMAAAFQAAEALRWVMLPTVTRTTLLTGATALNLADLQHGPEPSSDLCLCRCSRPVVRDYRINKYAGVTK